MPMPTEIERVAVTWGRGFDILGDPVSAKITITPETPGTKKLVWLATGDALLPLTATKEASGAAGETLMLPVVDQDGWVDASGQAYADWAYRAELTWTGSGGMQREAKVFKVLSGQTVVDLDLIFTGHVGAPTVAPLAVVTDVAGLSGSVTKAALEDLGLGGSTPIAPHPSFPGVLVIGE